MCRVKKAHDFTVSCLYCLIIETGIRKVMGRMTNHDNHRDNTMEIITIPCLYDNYAYLIVNDNSREAAVVDLPEAWPVMRELSERELKLTSVLCTHHHHDHIGGLDDLLEEFGELPVVGFHEDRKRIPYLNELLWDNDQFQVCGFDAHLLHTPGHTSTSVAFQIEDHLFVGDTLFGAGCGRLFEGTPDQMVHSLDRIVGCGKESKIYFGHEYTELNLRFAAEVDPTNRAIGERQSLVADLRRQGKPSAPSMLADECATNPFLRIEDASVIEQLRAGKEIRSTDRVSVFTALREKRNHFS